jgi:GxxExxY protein
MSAEKPGDWRARLLQPELLHGHITHSIIGCFYEVYNILGFGLFEKAYAESLAIELESRGHVVRREVPTQIMYKTRPVAMYKTDIIVDDAVVLEVKSTHRLNREDPRQVLNYLRATKWEVGLLLHFGPQPAFYRMVATNEMITDRGRD